MNRVRFIVAAIVLHLVVSTGIFFVGRFEILPNLVSPNGIIVDDSYLYRKEATALVETLYQQGVSAWASVPSAFHVKIYSLSYAIFGPVLGYNNLSAEPLNLIYFLAIIYLIIKLGEEIFDRRTGLLAAVVIALWPSFLVITTQLLRDPLFIVAMLTLALMITRCLTRDHSWRSGLVTGLVGGIAGYVLWIVRRPMWEVVSSIVLLGIVFLIVRQLRERQILIRNLAGAVLLLLMVISAPRVVPAPRNAAFPAGQASQGDMAKEQLPPPTSEEAITRPGQVTTQSKEPLVAYLVERIRRLRHRFIIVYHNTNSSSNLDTDVELNSVKDIALYLPRAAAIGFFAPFPNMWFTPVGQAARITRMVAGIETLGMYVIEVLAVIALWFRRRHLAAWFLSLIVTTGVIALGLVVINIGTLYRMRYAFWMLLVIVGVEGAVHAFSTLSSKKGRHPVERTEVSA